MNFKLLRIMSWHRYLDDVIPCFIVMLMADTNLSQPDRSEISTSGKIPLIILILLGRDGGTAPPPTSPHELPVIGSVGYLTIGLHVAPLFLHLLHGPFDITSCGVNTPVTSRQVASFLAAVTRFERGPSSSTWFSWSPSTRTSTSSSLNFCDLGTAIVILEIS